MKIIEKIEKFGLKNITGISIFLIISILLLDLIPYFFLNNINLLSTTNTLTFIGAIFVFWYGYKKYERDKELEFLGNQLSLPPKIDSIEILLFNWTRIYNLYQNNYIGFHIWNQLEMEYKKNFKFLLDNKDDSFVREILNKTFTYETNISYFWDFLSELEKTYNNIINSYNRLPGIMIEPSDQTKLQKYDTICEHIKLIKKTKPFIKF